ncbi:hypothetical protein BpHYR1_031053 [Brachionus plicatilis]|uniref:Uncharacterized protein n=1 Tax=Brachionus plicatilis TaxID=10195 RepID=A0A3M7RXS8_BRAPC|nr:hypothetical protein BpHYR1_031053 [Brachionus plicatilis]
MSYNNSSINHNLPLKINRNLSSNLHINENGYEYGYVNNHGVNNGNERFSQAHVNEGFDWSEQHDDEFSIETRDAESIQSTNISNQTKKTKPKLYTFYDYMNKNQNQTETKSNNEIKRRNLNKNFIQQNKVKPNSQQVFDLTGQFKKPYSSSPVNTRNKLDLTPEPTAMPISSGFGGYTNTTTRRKPTKKPEPKVIVSSRKPVKLQPLYRVNSDEDLQRTLVVDQDPEEFVQVVHRPRAKPKEKIIYVDDPPKQREKIIYVDDPPKQREKVIYVDEPPQKNVVYVDRGQSPQIIYGKQPSNQVVYAQPQQQQYVYQQPQVVYANQPQTYEQPQVQYILQPDTQYLPQSQYLPQTQYMPTQPQYMAQPQYIQQPVNYLDSQNYVYVTDPNVQNIPGNNIVYR